MKREFGLRRVERIPPALSAHRFTPDLASVLGRVRDASTYKVVTRRGRAVAAIVPVGALDFIRAADSPSGRGSRLRLRPCTTPLQRPLTPRPRARPQARRAVPAVRASPRAGSGSGSTPPGSYDSRTLRLDSRRESHYPCPYGTGTGPARAGWSAVSEVCLLVENSVVLWGGLARCA
jgi:hypothetical protein